MGAGEEKKRLTAQVVPLYTRLDEDEESGDVVPAGDIDMTDIEGWSATTFEEATDMTPEAAAEALARFRLRAGGDVSADYRDGYRSWRLGGASGAIENSAGVVGCHPVARREAAMDLVESSSSLYPTLGPAERDTPRYWWRYTVSYWVTTSFMIGSMLFTVGAGFDYFVPDEEAGMTPIRKSATVLYPYFVGGLFFLVGSYLGYFGAINLGRREDVTARFIIGLCHQKKQEAELMFLDIPPEAWHSFWGYLAYGIGALSFQFGILFEILALREFVVWPSLIGGVLFVSGAAMAVDVNSSWLPAGALTDVAWWSSNFNFFGSVLFLEAGLFSLGEEGDTLNFVKLPYFVGSACFLAASILELFMWRVELHGLSFVRAINKKKISIIAILADDDDDDDENNSSISRHQIFFVLVVIFTYTFSLMDLVFAARLAPCHRRKPFGSSAYDIYDSALQSLLCFAALALASVVHKVPKQRPFGMLIWILRLSMFLLLLRYAWKFVASWQDSAFECIYSSDVIPRSSAL